MNGSWNIYDSLKLLIFRGRFNFFKRTRTKYQKKFLVKKDEQEKYSLEISKFNRNLNYFSFIIIIINHIYGHTL